jgi:hypothetical protein
MKKIGTILGAVFIVGLVLISNHVRKAKTNGQNGAAWKQRIEIAQTGVAPLNLSSNVATELTNALVAAHNEIESQSFASASPEIPPPPGQDDYNRLVYSRAAKNAANANKKEVVNALEILLIPYPVKNRNHDLEEIMQSVTNDFKSK